MLRSCGPSALLVGGEHRLATDPCEYNADYTAGPGCNNLRCDGCGARVRGGPAGSRLKEDQLPGFVVKMYEAPDWAALPFIRVEEPPRWRIYACKCRWWEEPSEHLLLNDHESPGDPDLPWTCQGHPTPELPMKLGELAISTECDWSAIVTRILGGEAPRKLERSDEGPGVWLTWLYAYLRGLSVASDLSRAVGARVGDGDDAVVTAVLQFFRKYPTADGMEHVVAHAESDPQRRAWDVMISAMKQRTNQHTALEQRVVDMVRKVMLAPVGAKDPAKDTLTHHWNADAWRDDDIAWMAEHIVALDTAGPGRWPLLMNAIVSAGRKNPDLAHWIVIGGGRLIESGRVPKADLAAWIKKRGYAHEAWVLALETHLGKT